MEPRGDFSVSGASDTVDQSPVYSGTPRLLLLGADQADALSKAMIQEAQVYGVNTECNYCSKDAI
jgi:hypothetical protein